MRRVGIMGAVTVAPTGPDPEDERFMRLAVEQARRGDGCAQRRARDREGEHGDAEQAAGNERDHPEASGGSNPQYRQTLDRA